MGIDSIIDNKDYDRVTELQKFSQMVVEDEIKRLDSKKNNIDSVESNKARMILLNRSYQDRQRQYLLIMVLFVSIFLACLVIVFLQERLGYTSVMMDFLLVFVIGIGGISAFFLYTNILNRDKLDFSKMNEDGLLQPNDIIDSITAATDVASGDLIPLSVKECVGAECCKNPGYSYDTVNKKCKKG
jgi:hypothetical protein